MEVKKLKNFDFDRIVSKMQDSFGKLQDGEEDSYLNELFLIEKCITDFDKEKEGLRDSRILEALKIILFRIDGEINNREYQYSHLVPDLTLSLVDKLAFFLLPSANQELFQTLSEKINLSEGNSLRELYKTPVLCILKIIKSTERWNQMYGMRGYLDFIVEQFDLVLETQIPSHFYYKVLGIDP